MNNILLSFRLGRDPCVRVRLRSKRIQASVLCQTPSPVVIWCDALGARGSRLLSQSAALDIFIYRNRNE